MSEPDKDYIKEFKRWNKIALIEGGPIPYQFAIAVDGLGRPVIWVKGVLWDREKRNWGAYIITNAPSLKQLMFKDTGAFGRIEGDDWIKDNCWPTPEEAVEAYKNFYHDRS